MVFDLSLGNLFANVVEGFNSLYPFILAITLKKKTFPLSFLPFLSLAALRLQPNSRGGTKERDRILDHRRIPQNCQVLR